MGKRHNPEEIIGKLGEAEIVLAQGGTQRMGVADRGCRADLLSLAQGIWRSEDRPGAANEGSGEGESAAASGDL